MTTVRQAFRSTASRLAAALGSASEAEAAARIIFEDIAGYDRKRIFADGDREMTDYMLSKIEAPVRKVEEGMPVQYAVGTARFMGMDFNVSPAVLIPRPETEQLVDRVVALAQGRSDLRVLDVGTGSGCIAIALARALPFAIVEGIDISEDALAVARTNAAALKARVSFRKADALAPDSSPKPYYDFIVSNPPYVRHSERSAMDARVLDYEPATALFVPDDKPLLFYNAITAFASRSLLPGGYLCYECNRDFTSAVAADMQLSGFVDVVCDRDFRGNMRFVTGCRPR